MEREDDKMGIADVSGKEVHSATRSPLLRTSTSPLPGWDQLQNGQKELRETSEKEVCQSAETGLNLF